MDIKTDSVNSQPFCNALKERTFPLNSSLRLVLPSGVKNVGGLCLCDLAANKKINMHSK